MDQAGPCPACGKTVSRQEMDSSQSPPPVPVRTNWFLFFAVLLAPTLLTILCVKAGRATHDLSVGTTLLGGPAAGIICGIMLGRRLGNRAESKVVLSLVFAAALSVCCVGMSFFGCLTSGYALDLR
jgi:hypothetical protein